MTRFLTPGQLAEKCRQAFRKMNPKPKERFERLLRAGIIRSDGQLAFKSQYLPEASMAENWTYCPQCVARAINRRLKATKKVEDQYGKIPYADWRVLQAEAQKPFGIDRTFRENYEVGLSDSEEAIDGYEVMKTLRIIYRGDCTVCGYSVHHNDRVDLPELDREMKQYLDRFTL